MVNYNFAKIYRLTCNVTGLIYVGSTCEKYLCQRLCVHTSGHRKWKLDSKRPYCSSFKILDGNDWKIELIENVTCTTFDELACREGYFQSLAPCVNRNRAGRSPKQYYLDNIVKIRVQNNAYSKTYYVDNKEAIKLKQRERYKAKKLGMKVAEFQKGMEAKIAELSKNESKKNNI
jgi:hypothetical protein